MAFLFALAQAVRSRPYSQQSLLVQVEGVVSRSHLLPSVESTGAAQQIPRHRGLRTESSFDFCNFSSSFNSALLLPTGLQHVAAENMIAKGMAVSQANPPSEESPVPPKEPTSNVSCRCRQGTCSFLAVWSPARLSPDIALSTSRQADKMTLGHGLG